ncbi:MAG: hypothetical protein GF310_03490 [candidate division Zixibacteria bacterium]|nr:hypothetical protein [candidate division Zixibacteria bacterium]
MHPGLIGGILGGTIGLLGAVYGTYCSVKRAQTAKERHFILKAAALMTLALAAFLILLLTLESPWRFLLWGAYGIALPLGIVYINKKQQAIRQEESIGNKTES